MPGILPYLGRSTQPPRSRFHHEIWARSHFSPISIIAVGIEWCPNLRTSSARSREHSQVGTGPPWQLLDRPPGAGVGMPVVIGPAPAGPANGPLANQPGPDVPCQRREPLMRRWYGSGREGRAAAVCWSAVTIAGSWGGTAVRWR